MKISQLLGAAFKLPAALGDVPVTGLTADSRQVRPGFVFVAIQGSQHQGADFIAHAVAQGAALIITGADEALALPNQIKVANPRHMLALMARRYSGRQPDTVVAITGTNGKTSVASFVRQIWESMAQRAASIGTIGVVGPRGSQYLSHTTPDPVALHDILAQLKDDHVDHVALEASSHGLAQYRLDGIDFAAAGFTNLTQDHLDYHGGFAAYFAAKARLFTEILKPNSPAVINVDGEYGLKLLELAKQRGLVPFTVGSTGASLRLIASKPLEMGQLLTLESPKKRHEIALPLVGAFQASNALVAAGLVIALGGEETLVLHALENLQGAKGRLELVGTTQESASIFVDYAHTPDALENALTTLRPFTTGRLIVVFGCGGDRDKGKRPLMGKIADLLSDLTIITDDNPRNEEASLIRASILAACPNALEIPDRAQAIYEAIKLLRAGDRLLIAGKGHEEGQIIGHEVRPFSDHQAVKAALENLVAHE